jgi:hypothetical protein
MAKNVIKSTTHMRMCGSRYNVYYDDVHPLTKTYDAYATPRIAVEELLARESFQKLVWEPAAGLHHIANVFRFHRHEVFTSDIYRWDERTDVRRRFENFTHRPYNERCDIITNPPFSIAYSFMTTGLDLLSKGDKLALFLPLRYLESQQRGKLFTNHPPTSIYVFSYRLKRLQPFYGTLEDASAMGFAWFVWEKGYRGDTVIEWINKNDLVDHENYRTM